MKQIKLTKCCKAYSTYYDETLICKKCYNEVEVGEGDGTEYVTMNRVFNNIYEGAKITILKSYWYNGEGWYKTKEFGDIPNVFEITYNLEIVK